MGLLDDAIREHLDLKRRRGADPAEVERAEREALGPVRRNPEPLDDELDVGASRRGRTVAAYDQAAEFDVEEASSEVDAYNDASDEAYDREAEPDLDHFQAHGNPGGGGYGYADELGPEAEHEQVDHEHEHEQPQSGSFETAPPATRGPAPAFDGEGETAEFDVEHALADDQPRAADESDDVLEETPEFLQDAPEHDRLWFEQRPPRDFDFDR